MTDGMFDLSGRTALVTGSSRGIGKAIALGLGAAGAEVIFHASAPSARLDEAADEAVRAGVVCRKLAVDLSNPDGAAELAAAAGRVDLLILNASAQKYAAVADFDDAEFAAEFGVNVRASMRLIGALLPGMAERRFGRIVAIGSINQFKPAARLCVYAATKAAQANLIANVAKEYAGYGITANNVAPGVIATDRNREALADPERRARLLAAIPAGRFGRPEDCVGLVVLLCSEAGGYITGGDFPVAGGMQL